MTNFTIIGFDTHGMWVSITIKTTEAFVRQRAHEKGIVEILRIEA